MLPIPGTGSVAHLEENVAARELGSRLRRSPSSTACEATQGPNRPFDVARWGGQRKMTHPDVAYAKSGNLSIGYQVVGEGAGGGTLRPIPLDDSITAEDRIDDVQSVMDAVGADAPTSRWCLRPGPEAPVTTGMRDSASTSPRTGGIPTRPVRPLGYAGDVRVPGDRRRRRREPAERIGGGVRGG